MAKMNKKLITSVPYPTIYGHGFHRFRRPADGWPALRFPFRETAYFFAGLFFILAGVAGFVYSLKKG